MKTLKIITLLTLVLSPSAVFAQKSLKLFWRKVLPDIWVKYESLKPINEKHAKVLKEERWGVIDNRGRVIVPVQYKRLDIYPYWTDANPLYYRVSFDGKLFGLLNSKGKLIVPAVYSQLELLENEHIRACNYNGKCREFNSKGKDITPPVLIKYQCQVQQKNGLTSASPDGKLYGLTDEQGNWLLKPQFSSLICSECGSYWVVFDETGGYRVVLPKNPSWKSPVFEGVGCFGDGFSGTFGNDEWKLFDKMGNELSPMPSDYYHPSLEYPFSNASLATFKEKNLKGLISSRGDVVLPPIYGDISTTRLAGSRFYVTRQTDGREGVFHSGKWLLPCKYDRVTYSFTYPLFAAMLGDSTWIVDTLGRTVTILPFKVQNPQSKYFVDDIGKKYFWSPDYGLSKLPSNVESITSSNPNLVIKSTVGLFSILDARGREILQDFDDIRMSWSSEGAPYYYLLCKKGLWGMVDHTLQYGFEPQYDELRSISDGNFIAKKRQLYGLIDYKGNQVLEFKYKDSNALADNWNLKKNSAQGLFHSVPLHQAKGFMFDKIHKIKSPFLVKKTEGLYGLYDSRGRLLNNETFSKPPYFFDEGGFSFGEESQLAFYSSNGKRLTAHAFSDIQYVDSYHRGNFFIQAMLANGEYIYLNKAGKEMLRTDELIIRSLGSFISRKGDYWQFIDGNGNQLSNLQLRSILNFSSNDGWGRYYVGQDSLGKWHVVDLSGTSIHQFDAEKIGYIGENYNINHLYFTRNGKRYMLKAPGWIEKELKYDNGEEGLVKLNGKYGFVDYAGKELIPCSYDAIVKPGEIGCESSCLLAAKKGDLFDVFNRYTGERLLHDVYAIRKSESPTFVFYRKNGFLGILNPESGEVREAIYSNLYFQPVHNVIFYVISYQEGKGLLNTYMEQVLQPEYSSIQPDKNGNLILKNIDGKQWVFDGKTMMTDK
ncbi:MAG: hypothetical protein GC192_17990 [Bacteroidetes bacterium]|nr:hypothetical protein [Bacteroidota bacterium]